MTDSTEKSKQWKKVFYVETTECTEIWFAFKSGSRLAYLEDSWVHLWVERLQASKKFYVYSQYFELFLGVFVLVYVPYSFLFYDIVLCLGNLHHQDDWYMYVYIYCRHNKMNEMKRGFPTWYVLKKDGWKTWNVYWKLLFPINNKLQKNPNC